MSKNRAFVFALRDQMPLDMSGWSITLHARNCPSNCRGGTGCLARHVKLIQQPRKVDSQIGEATRGILQIIDEMIGGSTSHRGKLPNPGTPGFNSYAAILTPVATDPEDRDELTFQEAFSTLASAVDAIRIATSAPISPLTIERIWPVYTQLDGSEDEGFTVSKIGIVDDAYSLRAPKPATIDELSDAEELFASGINGDPVENIRYWMLGARNDARVNGDYAGAVLKAAAAAEVLIKSAAAILIWEQQEHYQQNTPDWSNLGPGALSERPHKLIANVLIPALGGGWSSQHEHQPVGAWRHKVGKVRSEVIHNGYRPTSQEVEEAVAAVDELARHVADRIASNAGKYPRSAVIMVGKPGLKRRGAWGKVRATVEAEEADWRAQYQKWTKGHSSDGFID